MNQAKQVTLLAIFLAPLFSWAACNYEKARSQQPNSNVEWVNTNQLKPGPIRREELSDLQIERIKKIQATFAEVDDTPLDEWMDGFKRDANPDQEIAVWERMARAYSRYIGEKSLSLEAKQDVLQVLLLRSAAPAEEVYKHLKLKVLTEKEAKEIMKGY
jgi:hypothetical protein